jgi:RNA polymerase sigma-70 factor (ECF subfamily)
MFKNETFNNEAIIHYNYFYRVAKRLTRNSMDAEDLVQDTYARAFNFFDTYREGSNCKAWLYTIMKRVYLSYYRKNNLMSETTIEQVPDSVYFENEENTLSREEMIKLMGKIKDEFKFVLILFHLDEFSLKEISDKLEWPLGTVKSRLHRGRKEFKKLLSSASVL